jgi:hypothetical protein
MGTPAMSATQSPPDPPLVVLASDLLISSRITSAARRLGVPVRLMRDPASLAQEPAARLLIVDLDLVGGLEAARAWAEARGRPAAGFVQHVHTDIIRAARAAGIDPIIPRSRLETALRELLTRAG